MWLNISAKAKQLFYHTKNQDGNISQNKSGANNQKYCRKHRKFAKLITLHNRNHQIQNCEKFSPIVTQKLAFSQVPWLLLYKQV